MRRVRSLVLQEWKRTFIRKAWGGGRHENKKMKHKEDFPVQSLVAV